MERVPAPKVSVKKWTTIMPAKMWMPIFQVLVQLQQPADQSPVE